MILSSAASGSDGTVYSGVDDPPASSLRSLDFGTVIALTPKGHLKRGAPKTAVDFVFLSSPSIASDGTIYMGDESGILHAIS